MPEEEGLEKKREKIVGFVKNLFKEEKDGDNSKEEKTETISDTKEEIDLKEKRTEFIKTLKKNKKKIIYLGLIIIIILGVQIRTSNLNLLKDTTTNEYIPVALDPHVFLRYTEYIVENGELFDIDPLRYYPLGYEHYSFQMAYMLAYLYKFLHFFNNNLTVAYVHVIHPVITFVIGLYFFFLLVKRLFNRKIALLSSLFLTIIPTYLYRTMAGFADHEAFGMLYFFMAFYFYIVAWQLKKIKYSLLFGILAGISTGLMGITFGAVNFIYLIVGGFVIIEIILGKFKKNDYYIYLCWFFSLIIFLRFTSGFISIYFFKNLFGIIMLTALGLSSVHFFFIDLNIIKIKNRINKIMPTSIFSLIITIIMGLLLISATMGISFIYEQTKYITEGLTQPFGQTRWQLTVAEQHQPYFTDWIGQMGGGRLLSFIDFNWPFILLFLAGSVLLFYKTIKPIGKRKIEFTIIYTLFIWAFIFSRYSQGSTLNGTNDWSKLLYIGSLIIFGISLGALYIFSFYKNEDIKYKNKYTLIWSLIIGIVLIVLLWFGLPISNMMRIIAIVIGVGLIYWISKVTTFNIYEKIQSIDKKYIFLFIWFLVMVVAARGAARLLFVFSPIICILASYFIFELGERLWKFSRERKDKIYRVGMYIVFAIFIMSIFSWPLNIVVSKIPILDMSDLINQGGLILKFTKDSKGTARWTGPSYNQQWQLAGRWIRENTPEDSVFAHWWDYGYWVQTGGKRATITDGGNEIGWWNYLMGRKVLTGQNQTEALQFLKAHDATHLLIISDEIGKYTAYSSIGSDSSYDRYSWMVNYNMDETQTQETRNETIYFYRGGWAFDEDFTYQDQIFPTRQAGLGAIFLPVQNIKIKQGNETIDTIKINQPTAAVVYNGKRTDIPIENVFFNDNFIKFDKPGLKGVFRIMPSISNNQQNNLGSSIYVSERVARTMFANLYLFNQKNPDYDTSAFELAYNDNNNMPLVLYNGRQIGPLKIWKINYGDFTITEKMRNDYIGREHLNLEATII